MFKRTVVTIATCAGFALLTSSASAAPIAGALDDPGGDVKVPEQDIVAVSAFYDPAGTVRAAVSTAAPATEHTVPAVDVMLGKASRKRGICQVQLHAFMLPDDEGAFGGIYLDGRRLGDQAVVHDGTILQFDTGEPRKALAGKRWNCGVAQTRSPKERRGDYVKADDTAVFPLTDAAGSLQSCRIVSRKVRRGGRLRAACRNVTGKVTVRLHRGTPRSARTTTVAPDGSVSAKLRRGVRRGGYLAAVWQGKLLLGSAWIRVR